MSDYCDQERTCDSLDEFADRVEQAFDDHYTRTSDRPDVYQSMTLSDRESNYNWEREGETTTYAIMNAAEIPEAVAKNLQVILDGRHSDFDSAAMDEDTKFAEEANYEQKGVDHSEWETH